LAISIACRKAGEIQYSFSKRDLSKFEKKKNKELGKRMINLEYKIQVEMFADKGMLQFRMLGRHGKDIGNTSVEYD
jgi:epoxyqueuosine reductase QueG